MEHASVARTLFTTIKDSGTALIDLDRGANRGARSCRLPQSFAAVDAEINGSSGLEPLIHDVFGSGYDRNTSVSFNCEDAKTAYSVRHFFSVCIAGLERQTAP
jgi:hypothetical protein